MSHRIEMPDHRERASYQNCNLSSSPLKQNNANELKARNVSPPEKIVFPRKRSVTVRALSECDIDTHGIGWT